MKNLSFNILGLTLLLLGISACGVSFQTNSLYDGFIETPPTTKPERIAQAVEPQIYDDSAVNFWTPGDSDCTIGEVVKDVVYSGDRALKISWERDPKRCEWAGFGIGWDDWAGKDISEVFEHAAIQMHIRTQEGKMFGLPCVLTLEDYSGKMAWSYTGASYFEKYYLDEEWQKVTVPLKTFDLKDEIDLGNIKQLMFELQQSGAIYLDDIQLIYYNPPPKEVYLPEEPTSREATYPVTIFDDEFINGNGWGVHEDHCQNIQLTTSDVKEGRQAIHAQWDTSKDDCYSVTIGASWNKWFPVDLTKEQDDLYLSVAFKSMEPLSALGNIRLGFEDYERAKSYVGIDAKYISGTYQPGQWQTVRIPMTAFAQAPFSLKQVKQLYIKLEGEGECWLDEVQLIR